MFFLNGLEDVGYLVEVQFACQYYHVGKLGKEAQRLYIGDVQLCGEVYLYPDAAGIGHGGDVAGDDGRDTGRPSRVDDRPHIGNVVVVDDGVYRQVTFHAVFLADGGNLAQIVEREVVG